MNQHQLKYILAIAETRNITAAAKKLYISQPSLSGLLNSVEKELGATLFERGTMGLVPTYAGECYINAAKKILNTIRELEFQINDSSENQTGQLSIGCGRTLSSRLFPLILPRFRKLYPGCKLKLYEDKLPNLHNMLISGELDIAITYTHINSKDLINVPLYRQEIVLLAPKSLELPHTTRISGKLSSINLSVSEISSHPFVIFKQGNNLRTVIDRIFEDYRVSPDIIIETDNWQTCVEMVKQEEALTILTYSEQAKHLNSWFGEDLVNFYRFDRDYYRDISIYYKKSTHTPKGIGYFIDLTLDIVHSYPFDTLT